MRKDIPKRKLLVISDTYVGRREGKVFAYEPVVRELNALSDMFDEIIWLGCKATTDNWALAEVGMPNVKVISMPSVHHTSMNGIRVLFAYPVFLWYVLKYAFSVTHIHTRGPSHPAIVGILFSFIDRKRRYWHKYAGDWINTSLPFTYRLQRALLKRLRFKNVRVTVNGIWPNMPTQVYAFENPCLYNNELENAAKVALSKTYVKPLQLLFVGNLVEAKGILQLIEAIKKDEFPDAFSDLYIAGNGLLMDQLKDESLKITRLNIHLPGQLNRAALNKLYEHCHVMILPSRAEGIPKVLAEASAYGCIPVVTDVSALSQYVHNGENGYLLPDNSARSICIALNVLAANTHLEVMGQQAACMSDKFTYEYFRSRIENEIFNS